MTRLEEQKALIERVFSSKPNRIETKDAEAYFRLPIELIEEIEKLREIIYLNAEALKQAENSPQALVIAERLLGAIEDERKRDNPT